MQGLRQQQGLEIAKGGKIKPMHEGWAVASQSGEKSYFVSDTFVCSCPDHELRGIFCKHAYAVKYYLKEIILTEQGAITKETKITYAQDWKNYNKSQCNEVRLFDELLKDLVQNIPEPPYVFGRPRLNLKETIFCTVQKVYSQLSSRRAHSLYKNDTEKDIIRKAPHFNAVSKLLNKPELTPILRELIAISAKPLSSVETTFGVDSSGFRTRCFGQYAEQKFDLRRQHKWLKAHVISGLKSGIITSVIIGDENSNDSPFFKPLVEATAENFTIKEVVADKGYTSRANYETVNVLGGQAYIPFKKNAIGNSRGSYLWTKMWHYFMFNREDFVRHYSKRSNCESVFSSIKKKLGDTLKSKNRIAQENELLAKILAYNITVLIQAMHELDISENFKRLN